MGGLTGSVGGEEGVETPDKQDHTETVDTPASCEWALATNTLLKSSQYRAFPPPYPPAPPTAPPTDPPLPIDDSDLPEDLFSTLLKCQSDKIPWRSLLAHAIALERPLLAILAACYEVG